MQYEYHHILNMVLKASMDGLTLSQHVPGVPSELKEHKENPFWHPLSKTSTGGMGEGNRHSESAE